jgi:predicted RNA binding protein YcfA (HicA-like mRNA interferase family)
LPKIPPISANRLIKNLEQEGLKVTRQKGSHVILINQEKNRIVVPMHPGKDIKPALLRAILREAGVNRKKFLELLKEK